MKAMNVASAVGLMLLAITQAGAQPALNTDSFVLTEKEAVGMLPAEVAAAPTVKSFKWSANGKYLLIHRESLAVTPAMLRALASGNLPAGPPAGETSLVLWDKAAHRSIDLIRLRNGLGSIREFEWVGVGGMGIAVVDEVVPPPLGRDVPPLRRTVAWRIDAVGGTAKRLVVAGDETYLGFYSSPSQPMAAIQLSRELDPPGVLQPSGLLKRRIEVILVKAAGSAAPPIVLGEGMSIHSWSANGADLILYSIVPREPGRKTRIDRLLMDPLTGRIDPTPLAEGSAHLVGPAPKREGDVRLLSTRQSLAVPQGAAGRAVHPLWLVSNTRASAISQALVSADVGPSEISPTVESVAFISNGALMVSQLVRLPKAAFLAMKEAADTATALSNAKQIGLAAMMYAQDHDEKLPGSGDDVAGLLSPYLKNSDILQEMTFTFGGGALKDVANPAETELGYVQRSGGRAIFYVDGHAKWKPDGK